MPAIAGQHRGDTGRQAAVAVEAAFELDQHGDTAADQVAAAVRGWDQGRVQIEQHLDPAWQAVAHLRG